MTYTYGDYITLDSPSARLTRLRLHIVEVSEAVLSPNLSGDGKSVDYTAMQQYLRDLKAEESRLAATVGMGLINGGVSLARNVRA